MRMKIRGQGEKKKKIRRTYRKVMGWTRAAREEKAERSSRIS